MTPVVDQNQERHWYWWGGGFLAVAAVFLTARLTSHNQSWTGWVASAFFALAVTAGTCGGMGLRFPLGRRPGQPRLVRRGSGVPRGRIPVHLSLLQHRRDFPEQYPAAERTDEHTPIDASAKPTLISAPGKALRVGTDSAVLHARNVGGLALLQGTRLCRNEGDRVGSWGGTLSASTLAPGERTSAVFNFTGQQARYDHFLMGFAWIEIDYTDAAGEREETALFHIEPAPEAGEWRVYQYARRRAGEVEPYASTGPGAVR